MKIRLSIPILNTWHCNAKLAAGRANSSNYKAKAQKSKQRNNHSMKRRLLDKGTQAYGPPHIIEDLNL